MPLLETKDLGIAFGGLQALDDVYITVDEKEIVGLIGPNGAGKTTVFNLLTGVYTPTKGAIRFEGKSILGRKPYQINRLGIARTFQNIRLFKNLPPLLCLFQPKYENLHRLGNPTGRKVLSGQGAFIGRNNADPSIGSNNLAHKRDLKECRGKHGDT